MPALLFAIFRKTRTQCLLGRTDNNHGTLVGIVGFRAGNETQDVQNLFYAAAQHGHLPPHNNLRNRILFLLLHLQTCSHTTQLPPPRLIFNPSPSRFSDSPRQLEYYALAWGITKVRMKEKGLRSAD